MASKNLTINFFIGIPLDRIKCKEKLPNEFSGEWNRIYSDDFGATPTSIRFFETVDGSLWFARQRSNFTVEFSKFSVMNSNNLDTEIQSTFIYLIWW